MGDLVLVDRRTGGLVCDSRSAAESGMIDGRPNGCHRVDQEVRAIGTAPLTAAGRMDARQHPPRRRGDVPALRGSTYDHRRRAGRFETRGQAPDRNGAGYSGLAGTRTAC